MPVEAGTGVTFADVASLTEAKDELPQYRLKHRHLACHLSAHAQHANPRSWNM